MLIDLARAMCVFIVFSLQSLFTIHFWSLLIVSLWHCLSPCQQHVALLFLLLSLSIRSPCPKIDSSFGTLRDGKNQEIDWWWLIKIPLFFSQLSHNEQRQTSQGWQVSYMSQLKNLAPTYIILLIVSINIVDEIKKHFNSIAIVLCIFFQQIANVAETRSVECEDFYTSAKWHLCVDLIFSLSLPKTFLSENSFTEYSLNKWQVWREEEKERERENLSSKGNNDDLICANHVNGWWFFPIQSDDDEKSTCLCQRHFIKKTRFCSLLFRGFDWSSFHYIIACVNQAKLVIWAWTIREWNLVPNWSWLTVFHFLLWVYVCIHWKRV